MAYASFITAGKFLRKHTIMVDPFGESSKETERSNSELDDLFSLYIINVVLNTFLSYSAIMLNITTIYVLKKSSSLSNPLTILLLSLAVSDLGVGSLVQPLYIALLVSRIQGHDRDVNLYYVFTTFLTLFSFASLFGVMALSVDRFLAVRLHLRYQELVTTKRVVSVVIAIWVFSACFTFFALYIPTIVTYMIFSIIDFACLLTTTLLNFKIFVAVRRLTRQTQVLQVQEPHPTCGLNSGMANAASLRKTAVGTFYVYFVFLVCYLPQICSYGALVSSVSRTVKQVLFLTTLTIVFLNSSLNPVIYCLKMRQFRRAVMALLRNMSANIMGAQQTTP